MFFKALRFARPAAIAVLGAAGIFGPGTASALESGQEIQTHLYALETKVVRLGESDKNGGGAAESIGDDLLVVTAKGRFVLVGPDGDVDWLDGRVPMNVSGWEADESFRDKAKRHFRVQDLLLKELSPQRFELFVTHHYFTGECVRFRLSSTIVELTRPPPPPKLAHKGPRKKEA